MLPGKRKDIMFLLPFVTRRFHSSVSCLSGPPILAIAPRPSPNWWELQHGVFLFKIGLQRKQIPHGTENDLEDLRSCSQT